MSTQIISPPGMALFDKYWATIGSGMITAQSRIESHFASHILSNAEKAEFIVDEMISRMKLQKVLA